MDGRLTGEESASFERHLGECAGCREEVKRLRELDGLLVEALGEEPEIDVRGSVERALEPRHTRHRVRWAAVGLAAAGLLVVAWLVGVSGPAEKANRRAIADGTGWLIRTQEADGHWDSKAHGSSFDFDMGVTGLSVLALMEAHEKTGATNALAAASKGADWLMAQEDGLGRFLRSHDQSRMYGQAVATLALLRVYEERPDAQLRGSIERALAFGVRAQSQTGGWSYVPGITADTSHTGWFVLVLARAKSDGFQVPETVLADAVGYVNGMTDAEGRVSYDVVGRTSPGLGGTAIAVNAAVEKQIYPETVACTAMQRVVKTTPDWNDRQQNLYLWFFASRGFEATRPSGEVTNWQRSLADTLVAHQERGQGAEFGSWCNNDTSQTDAGRVYATALAVVCLAQSR